MLKTLTFFFILVPSLYGQEIRFYKFGSKRVKFYSFAQKRILISENCVENKKLASCDGLKASDSISYESLVNVQYGGANLGALICKQQLKGKVLVGVRESSKSENSFCKLRSGSLIDSGTLLFYGRKNDKKTNN
ncbi:MAG: hypothetical protein CME64_06245 [Halobacteriovoraceae bacterium]|nr:hypothetical protein [Halobacteriovoraceae bacterium]